MRKKKIIREIIYEEDLIKAAKTLPVRKLKLAIELSDFCRYLQKSNLIQKGKND